VQAGEYGWILPNGIAYLASEESFYGNKNQDDWYEHHEMLADINQKYKLGLPREEVFRFEAAMKKSWLRFGQEKNSNVIYFYARDQKRHLKTMQVVVEKLDERQVVIIEGDGTPLQISREQFLRHGLSEPTLLQRFRYSRKRGEDTAFNKGLKNLVARGLKDESAVLQLGVPDADGVLAKYGQVPQDPVELPMSVLNKMIDKHEITDIVDLLEDLPSYFHDPMFVIKYSEHLETGRNVIIAKMHEGKPILIGLALKQRQGRRMVTEVRTLFDKKTKGLANWLQDPELF
jgi:hypothetical protein